VHLWGYESQADREQRRAAMAKDPAWQGFLAKAKELGAFVSQENSILSPSAFSLAK
jgi:NIPSNAP